MTGSDSADDSVDNLKLVSDWGAVSSAPGQQLNAQFTRPFPPCGSGLARETTLAYTMKHTVGVAVWRGQMEPRNLFNEKLCRQLSVKFSSAKLRRALYGIE